MTKPSRPPVRIEESRDHILDFMRAYRAGEKLPSLTPIELRLLNEAISGIWSGHLGARQKATQITSPRDSSLTAEAYILCRMGRASHLDEEVFVHIPEVLRYLGVLLYIAIQENQNGLTHRLLTDPVLQDWLVELGLAEEVFL